MADSHHTLSVTEFQHHRTVLAGAMYLLNRLSSAPPSDIQAVIATAAARSAAALV